MTSSYLSQTNYRSGTNFGSGTFGQRSIGPGTLSSRHSSTTVFPIFGQGRVKKAMSLSLGKSSRTSSASGSGRLQSMNFDLTSPLPCIDTSLQEVRLQEAKEITGLNNQFVSFIDQVHSLEKRNTQLTIQLDLLKKQGAYTSNIDTMFQTYIDNLKKQLESLGHEKLKFESDLVQMQGLVEDFKGKYEDEINKRTEMENEFVMVKKDVDESYMNKVELEAKLESLTDEIEFLKAIFAEEIRELQTQIQNTCVNVQVDSGRKLDVADITREIESQYAKMAERNRQDCEQWKLTKLQELSMAPTNSAEDLRIMKIEINELNNEIRKVNGDIDNLKTQRSKLEAAITEAEERGEMSLKESKDAIQKLQDAIQKAKQEMAKQAQELNDLMNVKMQLDIEIATYRKLLEGEEERISQGVKTLSIQQVQQQGDIGRFLNTSNNLSTYISDNSQMESSLVNSSRKSQLWQYAS